MIEILRFIAHLLMPEKYPRENPGKKVAARFVDFWFPYLPPDNIFANDFRILDIYFGSDISLRLVILDIIFVNDNSDEIVNILDTPLSMADATKYLYILGPTIKFHSLQYLIKSGATIGNLEIDFMHDQYAREKFEYLLEIGANINPKLFQSETIRTIPWILALNPAIESLTTISKMNLIQSLSALMLSHKTHNLSIPPELNRIMTLVLRDPAFQ